MGATPTAALSVATLLLAILAAAAHDGVQPLSKIAIHRATFALNSSAFVEASPTALGSSGNEFEWVDVRFGSPNPTANDWIGVFSPAKFNGSACEETESPRKQAPFICSAPIKPKLLAVSNNLSFDNPKAPLYPRLALGKSWNESCSLREGLSGALQGGIFSSMLFYNHQRRGEA